MLPSLDNLVDCRQVYIGIVDYFLAHCVFDYIDVLFFFEQFADHQTILGVKLQVLHHGPQMLATKMVRS